MTRVHKKDIYGGKDPRDLPLYAATEAAHFLQLPLSTVRAWAFGQRGCKPVLQIPDRRSGMLSFKNLVELHGLAVLPREKRVCLANVRKVIATLQKHLGEPHRLLSRKLLADKSRRLFVEICDQLIHVKDGQVQMREVVEQHLARIDRDDHGIPIRLFPFPSARSTETARAVAIDPTLQFGKPCLAGTRIVTTILAARIKAGDSMEELANDCGRPKEEIEPALHYHIAA